MICRKTALMLALCELLRDKFSLAAVSTYFFLENFELAWKCLVGVVDIGSSISSLSCFHIYNA